MEYISLFVEKILALSGISGSALPVFRHLLLVFVAILLAWLAGAICQKLVVPMILNVTKRTPTKWDDIVFNKKVLVSACHIVPAVVVWKLLPLVFFQYPDWGKLIARLTAIYITIMFARTCIAFLSSFKDFDQGRRTSAQQYILSFLGVLKILIIFIASIVVIAYLIDKSPMTLFAGLGATSAILMLVFQDTIKGLVAGVRLTSNDMLHKGDWITVPKANADGVVEDMSLTTVKIRNFDNTIITVTPQTLVDDSFQNWNGMQQSDGRRVNRKVYIDFRTIRTVDDNLKQSLVGKKYFKEDEINDGDVNLTLFRRYVEKYLLSQDTVNPDMLCMVREFEPSHNGVPVGFYFFLKNKEWKPYEMAMAEIMDHIYAFTPDFGLAIYQDFNINQK